MSTNTYLLDALVRHQVYLQRYAKGRAKKVEAALKRAGREIERTVGEQAYPEIAALRRIVADTISGVGLTELLLGESADLAEQEAEYLAGLLDRSTRADIVRVAPEVAIAAATESTMELHSTTGVVTRTTLTGLVAALETGITSRAVDQIRAGIIEGDSIDALASRLSKVISGTATRAQARSVAITATNHVTAEARSVVAAANADILDSEEFVATLDSRTTLICAGYDGQIFAVGDGPRPPLHYRCRSLRVPKVAARFGLSGLTGERPSVGSDGVEVVSGSVTYGGWLSRQSAEFQNETLGVERAKLFRSGAVSIDGFTDSSGKVYTLKELRAMI